MKYTDCDLDKKLRNWFKNDNSKALLRRIKLHTGNIRSLTPLEINFNYPITAIAGKNGSGKSTILGISCCAFHNNAEGFCLPNRKSCYYTFADFFIQHTEEVHPDGIEIGFSIAYNKWRITKKNPNKEGVKIQVRRKSKGGRWNDYARRIHRDVVFLGIERIVPHAENSHSKSYSKSFSYSGEKGWEKDVRDTVGQILGKKYDNFKFVSHSKYRLPIVSANNTCYSGFNMGAGENALFEVFSIMHSVSEGALIVIDEIELGLHSEAQKKFIGHLKKLCKKRKLQVICTTHSRDIFSQLPDDARIFLENTNGKSLVLDSISPDYAFSKLSAENSYELNILVEDKVAKSILQAILPSSIRSRISIEVIGSASALARQLAANYNRELKNPIIVIFDGDQKARETANFNHACKMAESKDDNDTLRQWFKSHVEYIPGETWPEFWLIQQCAKDIESLSEIIGIDSDKLSDVVKCGLGAGKHNEFYEIGKLVGLDEENIRDRFCLNLAQQHKPVFQSLVTSIEERLKC